MQPAARRRRRILGAILVTLALPFVVWMGLPWPWALKWIDPGDTAFTLRRERQGIPVGDLREQWVPYERIPERLRTAVVEAEDGRFWRHGGVDFLALADELRYEGSTFDWRSGDDWRKLAGAVRYGWEHRSELRGRSAIPQQLAKNLFFGPERSVLRKAMEMFVARRLVAFLGRERTLELYINTAEMGEGVFGMGAAARHYYGKPLEQVGAGEARALAATLPSPLTRNPARRGR